MQIKKYIKFLTLFFGIACILLSCEKEAIETAKQIQEIHKSPYKMWIIDSKEINENSQIVKELVKFKNENSNILHKDIYNSAYNFTVNTDYSKYIESNQNGLHSYTFLIEREENNNLLENLVLTLQPDGTYTAEVVAYDFINDGQVEIKIAPLENFDTSVYLSKTSSFLYSCTTTVTYTTTFNGDCSCQYIAITDVETNCIYTYIEGPPSNGAGGLSNTIWTSGGGGSSSANNTNNNQGTGTDTNTTTTTTSPFLDLELKRKRDYLKQLVENPTIFNKLNELAPKVNSDQSGNYREDGARFKFIADNNYEIRLPSKKKGSSIDYTPDYQLNEVVSVHIHQTKAYKYLPDGTPSNTPFPNSPIYSAQDVIEFLENLNYIENINSDITKDVTSLLMAEKPNTPNEVNVYALVVERNRDKNNALNAFEALQNDEIYEQLIEQFEKEVLKDWKEGNCDTSCIIENFVNFINNYEINGESIGISIYQYNNNNGVIKWIKL